MRLMCALVLLLAACGPNGNRGGDDGGPGGDDDVDSAGSGFPDTSPGADAGNDYSDGASGDAACAETSCDLPVDDGCGASEICDDGLDNDCNLAVDDGCSCTPGDVQPCFLGPPGRRGVGSCEDGTHRCEGALEFGEWGPCEGGIWPTTEQCDTQDNNCNGCADDSPDCCEISLACPGPGDLPEGSPFTDYVIDGTMFFSGPATSWSWTVVGGPCDQLLFSTSGTTSYTVTGANSPMVTFRPTLSGDYTFTMTVVGADGMTYSCTFIVHVRGPGLRAELCWDTTGATDIDLHVHRPGTTTNWFSTDGTSDNPDDCFYANCTALAYLPCPFPPPLCMGWPTGADWGYPASPLSECSGSPSGAEWTTVGSCHNPRLDIDNISEPGIPENINLDVPNDGETFRVMVHYFGGSTPTHPMVNIYCGGHLLGTYGAAPDLVAGFNTGEGYAAGTMWRVVDATTHVAGGVTTGCDLTALHPPGMASGYWVTNDDTTY